MNKQLGFFLKNIDFYSHRQPKAMTISYGNKCRCPKIVGAKDKNKTSMSFTFIGKRLLILGELQHKKNHLLTGFNRLGM